MISLTAALAALRAFKEATNNNTVDEATLQSRLAVCSACPKRRLLKHTLRDGIAGAVARLANAHRVPASVKDYKCDVCGCPLTLLAPALPEHLHRDSPEEAIERKRYAPSCWVLKEVPRE